MTSIKQRRTKFIKAHTSGEGGLHQPGAYKVIGEAAELKK